MSRILQTLLKSDISSEARRTYMKRNLIVLAILIVLMGAGLALIGTRASGYLFFASFAFAVIVAVWEFVNKQTILQLRRNELTKGRAEAEQILKDVGIHTYGKK